MTVDAAPHVDADVFIVTACVSSNRFVDGSRIHQGGINWGPVMVAGWVMLDTPGGLPEKPIGTAFELWRVVDDDGDKTFARFKVFDMGVRALIAAHAIRGVRIEGLLREYDSRTLKHPPEVDVLKCDVRQLVLTMRPSNPDCVITEVETREVRR